MRSLIAAVLRHVAERLDPQRDRIVIDKVVVQQHNDDLDRFIQQQYGTVRTRS